MVYNLIYYYCDHAYNLKMIKIILKFMYITQLLCTKVLNNILNNTPVLLCLLFLKNKMFIIRKSKKKKKSVGIYAWLIIIKGQHVNVKRFISIN